MINEFELHKGIWRSIRNPHLCEKINKSFAKDLLKRGGLIVRNLYDFDNDIETSYWYVIKDNFGGMDELSSNMRNQIRKCLKSIEIKQITKEFLALYGYDVYCAAAENYKVKCKVPSNEEFLDRVNNGVENQYWGCFEKSTGKLVAFCMNLVLDDYCNYCTMKAIPEYRKKYYAYYGLIYEMNRYYLDEIDLKYVTDGMRSITEHSNMQPFLIEKFKFRKSYCKGQIFYKWWLYPLVLLIYPFRNYIKHGKIHAILNLETMRRGK